MRYFKIGLMVAMVGFTSQMVIHPDVVMEAMQNALELCVRVVIPSLFPFFVSSRILIALGLGSLCSRLLSRWMRPLFGVPGCGAVAVVLGVISGYPVGAATVAGLVAQGSCTKAEGERLLSFCNNAGPMFVLGSVGVGMLHSQQVGMFLYLVHLVSAILTGLLFRKYHQSGEHRLILPPGTKSGGNSVNLLADSVADGLDSIIKVCGFVLFFSVFCSILPIKSPWIHAMLEITGGLKSLIEQHSAAPYLLSAVSFFLAVPGLSVILQTAGIVSGSGLSMKPFLFGKLVQGGISVLLTGVLYRIFPLPFPVFLPVDGVAFVPSVSQLLGVVGVDLLVSVGFIGVLCLAGLLWGKICK